MAPAPLTEALRAYFGVYARPPMAKDTLNPKQEAFAFHLARGLPMGEAYRLAGFRATGNHVFENASKLAKSTKVSTKVDQERAKLAEARMIALQSGMIVTAQSVGAMLAEVFRNATADKQHGAAATAAMGLAKLHGLLVERTEDVTRRATRDPAALREITVDDWMAAQQGQGLLPPSEPSPEPGPPILEPTIPEPGPPGMEADYQTPDVTNPEPLRNAIIQGPEPLEPLEPEPAKAHRYDA